MNIDWAMNVSQNHSKCFRYIHHFILPTALLTYLPHHFHSTKEKTEGTERLINLSTVTPVVKCWSQNLNLFFLALELTFFTLALYLALSKSMRQTDKGYKRMGSVNDWNTLYSASAYSRQARNPEFYVESL